jgi:predicted TIM-barrel fold metal-dependent hydrolase
VIVDVHSHTWLCPEHIGHDFVCCVESARMDKKLLNVRFEDYMAAAAPCDRSIVFGLRGLATGIAVPNDHVADFVAKAPKKLIGFMSLDPNEAGWMGEFERCRGDLKMKGVKLGPIYAAFNPTDRALDPLYAACVRHNLPVLVHVGTSFVRHGPLEWSRPILMDEVARRFPDLKLILAHMGHPWEGETISVIRKHANVYADISALHYRPWQFYNSMVLAQEYRAQHKILFGTDYPFTTAQGTMDGLRSLNRFAEGTNLPRLDRDALEGIINRDSIQLLWGGEP